MLHAGAEGGDTGVIDYDARTFRASGGRGEATVAVYHQQGDLLWGEFSGGPARRGSLTGRCAPDGTLEFAYAMVLYAGEVISGRCTSTPELLDDGRIRLHEKFVRYGPHSVSGLSCIEEIRTEPELSKDITHPPEKGGLHVAV